MGLDKKDKDKAEKAMVAHLVDFGLDRTNAENLAGRLKQFKELPKDDVDNPWESSGSKDFKEKEARDINIDGQARMDMARFLLDVKPDDPIEKRVAMSEIPPHALMHLVMSKTLDDLCSKRNGDKKKTSPIEVFLGNYTTFMLGINRKSRKEGLQIFETDAEKGKEDMGLFPPKLKG